MITHEKNSACEEGHCLWCNDGEGPYVYFCNYCLLPNCGFAECRAERKKRERDN